MNSQIGYIVQGMGRCPEIVYTFHVVTLPACPFVIYLGALRLCCWGYFIDMIGGWEVGGWRWKFQFSNQVVGSSGNQPLILQKLPHEYKLRCGGKGLIRDNKILSSYSIIQEITRILGTLWQKLGMQTKYLFFIISQYHSSPPGLWTQMSYRKILTEVKRYWHISKINSIINDYPAHHPIIWKCLPERGYSDLQAFI